MKAETFSSKKSGGRRKLKSFMLFSRNKNLIVSYLSMRRLIGILGIALPVIVVAGGFLQREPVIQESISSYYYTNMRDFFVGLLCGVSIFLLSYKGYEKIDNMITNISGAFAFGMILFPTSPKNGNVGDIGIFLIDGDISRYLHMTFGVLFFLMLSFNSIFLFTKRNPGIFGKEKKRRNLIHRICGGVMLLAIVFTCFYVAFLKGTIISQAKPVLICESIALLAFGVSWLVKGDALFKDKLQV